MEDIDASVDHGTPVWAVFGDLMAGLLGAFVLILVGVLGVQLELVTSLEAEIQKRQQEEQRREALEKALAGPLASGRVTLSNGKIGISGNVLFALNSDQLQPEGKQLLKSLSQPIAAYLGASEQMLMVSGFTDDMPVRGSNSRFADNWELSAQARPDRDAYADRRRRAFRRHFCRCLWLATARSGQQRCRRPRPQPPRRNGAGAQITNQRKDAMAEKGRYG